MDFQTVADGVIDPARDVQQELLAKPETLYMLAAEEAEEAAIFTEPPSGAVLAAQELF